MNKNEQLCINAIRVLSAEAVQKANSGHPGLPMGSAAMAFTLWSRYMKHSPGNPNWADRDRFILSAGHGSMLVYSLLHLFGYGLSVEDLKNFRQYGSKTPGHPEYGHVPGVETTTGPLGQGFANGVGMALAEAYLAEKFNRPGFDLVDHYTYVLSGDGCMMEGITSEAASLAGTLALGKLIVFYDANAITIEGSTDLAFTEDVGKRFEAYHWQVVRVADGNDTAEIAKAIEAAKLEKGKPSLIVVHTQIGYGCPAKQGKASAHGEPLGEENVRLTKEYLDWDTERSFHVPEEAYAHMDGIRKKLGQEEAAWNQKREAYARAYPELAAAWEQWQDLALPEDFPDREDIWKFDEKPAATRNVSGEILHRLSTAVPNLIGGAADLAPSTKTFVKGRGDFSAVNYGGANLHFGVREHAMAAVANGIALHGGLRPYVATFFVFSDYMKPAMRLSSIMGLPVTYVLTHDSIGVGEDGPTHQPVEQLAALRSLPNFTVFRPADAKETAAGWVAALTRSSGPVALVLTRQNLPYLKETGKEALKGAYILADSQKAVPDAILMASGSEVSLIYEARKLLEEKGVDARVVSMPSWELFEEQSEEYKDHIFPKEVKVRLAVEAASSFGWHKYAGTEGGVIAIDTFGLSGPYQELFRHFGLTVENIVRKTVELIDK